MKVNLTDNLIKAYLNSRSDYTDYTFGALLSFVLAVFNVFFLNEVIELNRAPLPLVCGGAPFAVTAGGGGDTGGGAGTEGGAVGLPWLFSTKYK